MWPFQHLSPSLGSFPICKMERLMSASQDSCKEAGKEVAVQSCARSVEDAGREDYAIGEA